MLIKEIYSPDRYRRLSIIQRDDGLFCFSEHRYLFDDYDKKYFWSPAYGSGVYESAEAAENEARVIIPWMKELHH
jgi:hypothetical protein